MNLCVRQCTKCGCFENGTADVHPADGGAPIIHYPSEYLPSLGGHKCGCHGDPGIVPRIAISISPEINRDERDQLPIHKPCGTQTIESDECEQSSHGPGLCNCMDGMVYCPTCKTNMSAKHAANDPSPFRYCTTNGRNTPCTNVKCNNRCYLLDMIICPLPFREYCAITECLRTRECTHPMRRAKNEDI